MKSSFSFTAKIWKWPGMGPASSAGTWHFVHLPREYFEPIRAKYGKGMVKVSATLGKTTWDTSLFPHTKDCSFLISIKAKVRKAEDVMAGDEVKVRVKIK
jgi:hypothetical protein